MNPIVPAKLREFDRRRRRLLLLRGLAGMTAVWLAWMLALAVTDRLAVLPDAWRMGLSLAGYVFAAGMFWFECGRHLGHRADDRELARRMELAAPPLREKLLAAVELAEADPRWDSPEFRAAVQQAAARDVAAFPTPAVLPVKLIAGWLAAAAGVFLLGAVLMLIPGWRLAHAFVRAAVPGANLPRLTDVEITVLAPAPPDALVPAGDVVPVVVESSQPATLELKAPPDRKPMAAHPGNQFTAAVAVQNAPLEYRIRAGHSLTRWHTLTPRPRPQIVRYLKTYHYPGYTRLPAMAVAEETGDLDALEGTVVDLVLEPDQPIAEAALQIETAAGKQETPLARDANGRLLGRVSMTAAGTYQVRLIAAATGFENKFRPQSEIRVRPDRLPTVVLDEPAKEQLLDTNAVVAVTGRAMDDLGIVDVVQAVQVNRAPWQMFPVTINGTGDVTVARVWNLRDLNVQPGDQLLTKLVATDLKGQRAESAAVRLRIAGPGFDPVRHAREQDHRALQQALRDLRETADDLAAKSRAAKARQADDSATALEKQQALLGAATVAAAADRQAEAAFAQIQALLPRAESARESADLALLGRALSRARHDGIRPLKTALDGGNFDDSNAPLAAVGRLRALADAHRQLFQESNLAAAHEARQALRDRTGHLTPAHLEDRATLEELRPHADAQFVQALSRAAEALAAAPEAAPAVENAVRQLETGHALAEQAAALRQLAAAERWEWPVAHTNRAADWAWSRQELDRQKIPPTPAITAEFNQRLTTGQVATNLAAPVTQLADTADQMRRQLEPALAQARADIESLAPLLSDRFAALARDAERQESAGKLDQRIADGVKALRRDANAQDLGTPAGRERARDGDSALARLRPGRRTAADFQLIADHYRNLEAGQPELTRAALREPEATLGMTAALNAQAAQAAALRRLTNLPADQQLAELERALDDTPPLRQALSELARATLQTAARKLEKATAPPDPELVREAGRDVARAGRHESRLGQEPVGQQMQQLGKSIESQTADAVANAANAAAAQAAIQAALAKVNALKLPVSDAVAATGSAGPATNPLATLPAESAQWLARALDSADAGLNPGDAVTMAAARQASATHAARRQEPGTGVATAGMQRESDGGGGSVSGSEPNGGELPEARMPGGMWGKLPPKLARDLLESQREGVEGEYREMVELYFRALAEKAREGSR